MPALTVCDSCQLVVPHDPDFIGWLTLEHAPDGSDRCWPMGVNGKLPARLCLGCVFRVTMLLFGPGVRREAIPAGQDTPAAKPAIFDGARDAGAVAQGA
jgi:hypothetical protein